MALGLLIRRMGSSLRLFETTKRDVEMVYDRFVPTPEDGTKGIRVLVLANAKEGESWVEVFLFLRTSAAVLKWDGRFEDQTSLAAGPEHIHTYYVEKNKKRRFRAWLTPLDWMNEWMNVAGSKQ